MARLQEWSIACVVVLVSCSVCAADTILVGPGEAFTEIQPAIDAAKDGDTVLVKPGEYVIAEPIDFNRLHNPDDPASPPVKNLILRSEGGAEVTKIRMGDAPADSDRASVVIFENGEDQRSTLEGFAIEGGKGVLYSSESWDEDAGGGWEYWFGGGGVYFFPVFAQLEPLCDRSEHL